MAFGLLKLKTKKTGVTKRPTVQKISYVDTKIAMNVYIIILDNWD